MIIPDFIRSFLINFLPGKELYKTIYRIFGFYPDNIIPYKIALHHRSVPFRSGLNFQSKADQNNERLEFLGDAVLGSIVAEMVFRSYPLKDEGFMSEMRSKIVNRVQLNKLALKIGLDAVIVRQNDVRSKSLDGNAFEAVVGAIYMDKGYNFTRKIIRRLINDNIDIQELENVNDNFKSQLLEWGQKHKHTVEYKVINTKDDASRKQYVVRAFIDGQPYETGKDYSIKGAEQQAAKQTLLKLQIITKTEKVL